jgi:ADP-ribose pyrophosphatase
MSFGKSAYTNGHTSGAHHALSTYLSEQLVFEGKWLKLSKIKYLDPEGVEREWEGIARVTRPPGSDTDAITAIAIYRRMLHYDVVVLVRQYRPPLNKYTIEFPSGLLEVGETDDEAAVRELLEETGWHGEVTHMGLPVAADPGSSSVTFRYATVKINGDALENQNIKPQPSDGEFLDVIMVPLSEVHEKLQRLAAEGNMIDSKLAIWSIGLQMGLKVAKDAEQDAFSTSQASLPMDDGGVRGGMKIEN